MVRVWSALASIAVFIAGADAEAQGDFLQRLNASDTASFEYQARSLAVSGDTLVVGGWGDSEFGQNAGAAHVYEFADGAWTEVAKLTASDARAESYFGFTVAIHDELLAVGAYRDRAGGRECGAAYIFRRTAGQWVEQDKIVPRDGARGDQFSYALAILDDTVIATSRFADAAGSNSGAAYAFVENSSGEWRLRDNLVPSELGALDEFGIDCAAHGDTVVIGAYRDDRPGRTDPGAAYIFTRGSDGRWRETQRLRAPDDDADEGDWFGISVAVRGDVMAIGARRDDEAAEDAGAVYVLTRDETDWAIVQKLTSSTPGILDFFGASVDVKDRRVLVGTSLDDANGDWSGSATLFRPSIAGWVETDKYLAPDGGVRDYLGVDVALADETLILGAPEYEFRNFTDTGAAYVFRLDHCPAAEWNAYGSGVPGTLGIPTLEASDRPRLDSTIDVTLTNSAGTTTTSLLFIGLAEDCVPAYGGKLLVAPIFTRPIALPAQGRTWTLDVADDPELCGAELFSQAFQLDVGASLGVSITRGLRLRFGR